MATILIDKNVMVPMRDGVRLATDVYWLDGAAPAPVLLSRTPYDKEHALVGSTGVPFDILRAVQAGYAVMIQDVRGRYGSEGEFDPMFQETRDGVDTIAWAADQPWSRGVVGTFGGSYVGGTQWLPAREHPLHSGRWRRRSPSRTCMKATRIRVARRYSMTCAGWSLTSFPARSGAA